MAAAPLPPRGARTGLLPRLLLAPEEEAGEEASLPLLLLVSLVLLLLVPLLLVSLVLLLLPEGEDGLGEGAWPRGLLGRRPPGGREVPAVAAASA